MMAERGLSIAHTTIMRWVRHYAPEFEKTLATGQPLLARSCGNHGVADKVRAPLHSTSTSRPRNSWQGQRAASDDIVPHVEIRPRWRGIPLALQASFDYARCRADSELSLKMTDADKIVAATFAVARCGGLGHSKPEDYIAEYDIFLRLLDERQATAERAKNDASPSPWKFGS
jgi:hypothetical protein